MRNNKKEVMRDLLAEHMQNEGASVRTNTVSRAVAQKVDRSQTQHTLDSSHPVWNAKWYYVAFAANWVLLILMVIAPFLAHRQVMRGTASFSGYLILFIPRLRTPSRAAIHGIPYGDFALLEIVLFLLPIIIFTVAYCMLIIRVQRGHGTPELLERSAMLAVFMSLGYIIYDIAVSSWIWVSIDLSYWWWTSFPSWLIGSNHPMTLVMPVIVCSAPFLCVFLNIRKHDKSLSLARALKFWSM